MKNPTYLLLPQIKEGTQARVIYLIRLLLNMVVRLIKPSETDRLYALLKNNASEDASFFEDWDDIENNFSETYICADKHNQIQGFFLLSEFEDDEKVWIQMMESFRCGAGTIMVNWLKIQFDELYLLSLGPSKGFWLKMDFEKIEGASSIYSWTNDYIGHSQMQ